MRGSIVKRMTKPRDGSKPRARYYVKIGTGSSQRWLSDPGTGSGFKRKADAEAHLAKTVAAMNAGTWVAPSSVTTGEHLLRDLELAKGRLKSSTWASYEKTVRVYVLPRIGNVPLQKLTADHLDQMYIDLLASGGRGGKPLTPRTVKYTHVVVKAALRRAVDKGLIVRNPADAATAPSASRAAAAPGQTWSAGEVAAFLSHSQDHWLGGVWAFLALTGCRRGEAIALKWSDVDLDAGKATVRASRGRVGRQVVTDSPKSGRIRVIDLDPGLVQMLGGVLEEQRRHRRLIGAAYQQDAFVFTDSMGSALNPETVSNAFAREVKRSGLRRIRLHDLRHTWASLALAAGVHPKKVQRQLGHAHVSITLAIYSHLTDEDGDDAAAMVAGLIGSYGGDNVVPLRKAVDGE